MLKLFPLKIPEESDIGVRFKAEAEKAGLTYWELLGRLLRLWEEKNTLEQPATPESSVLASRITELETRLAAIEDRKAEEDRLRAETAKAEEDRLKAETAKAEEDRLKAETAKAEEDRLKAETAKAEENRLKAFEVAYLSLERDRHAMIWALRETLGWPRDQFDAVLRQLRDEGRYQPMRGGETEHMTKKQLRDGFVDENGLRHLTIMRVPSAAAEPMAETPVPEVSPAPAPRKRGRPPKVQKL